MRASVIGAAGLLWVAACAKTGGDNTDDAGQRIGSPVLQLGVTVHLENHAPYDSAYFDRLRSYGTLFLKHNAKLTLEPRQEVWTALTGANANLFAELEAQGHAFAVHAALGKVASYNQFVAQLTLLRTELASKGVTVEHASGQCQGLDWVSASVAAGYKAMTGGTENCLLSLSAENRPFGYQNLTCANAAQCHGIYPRATEERLHPWRAKLGSNWLTDDPTGQLVILPSSGTLPCLEEEAAHPGQLSSCAFTEGDIALAKAEIDRALVLVDEQKINQLYFVWSFGLELSDTLLETWFAMVKPYVEEGKVVWRTASEVYDSYVAWEATHRP